MRVVYSERYHVDIGPHVFRTVKYRLVHKCLQDYRVVPDEAFVLPVPASWADLERVHTASYLRKVRRGELSLTEAARLELPQSRATTEWSRLMTGGTVTAARHAVKSGGAVHLGGGFHHAFADHGEGFCMFNDAALAIRLLINDRLIDRVAVVDCDVHHGNGTAKIFETDPDVFTFSMHQDNNYPTEKPPGTLDLSLVDATDDSAYLAQLSDALLAVMAHCPDLLVYLAGADPYERDQLGGLALTKEGLRARDRMVLATARENGVPIVVTLAGGYAHELTDTVDIHVATVEEAVAAFR